MIPRPFNSKNVVPTLTDLGRWFANHLDPETLVEVLGQLVDEFHDPAISPSEVVNRLQILALQIDRRIKYLRTKQRDTFLYTQLLIQVEKTCTAVKLRPTERTAQPVLSVQPDSPATARFLREFVLSCQRCYQPLLGSSTDICARCHVELLTNDMFSKFASTVRILTIETTGMSPLQDHPVDIAVLDIHGSVLFNLLIRPPDPERLLYVYQSCCAADVHGITPSMVAHAPTIFQVYPQLAALINDSYLITYNMKFVWPILIHVCRDYRLPYFQPKWGACVLQLRGQWTTCQFWRDMTVPYYEPLPGDKHRAIPNTRIILAILRSLAGLSVDNSHSLPPLCRFLVRANQTPGTQPLKTYRA